MGKATLLGDESLTREGNGKLLSSKCWSNSFQSVVTVFEVGDALAGTSLESTTDKRVDHLANNLSVVLP